MFTDARKQIDKKVRGDFALRNRTTRLSGIPARSPRNGSNSVTAPSLPPIGSKGIVGLVTYTLSA